MRLRPKLNKKTGNVVNVFRFLFMMCAVMVLTSFTHQRMKGKGITTVVIDAGHGGHDSGCLGSHAKEKDVTLAVALKLGRFISENFKDIKVIYTRKTDVFLGLDERVAVANNNKADLFISVHCNSGARAAYGVETYVMGLHRTEENLAVSKRENSVVLLEKDYKTKYEGFDPDSPEGNIIFTLYQNAFLDQSLKFSTFVQMETSDFAGRHNRGVKQAGFLVLYKTSMPSILIEAGFLTNPAEERYLLSKEGQEKLAYSFFKAFTKYQSSIATAVPAASDLEAKNGEPKPELTKPQETAGEPKKFVVKPAEEKTTAPAESTAVKSQRDTIVKAKTAEKIPSPSETAVKSQKDSIVKEKVVEKVPVQPAESTAVKLQRDTMAKAKLLAEKVPVPAESTAVKSQKDSVVKEKVVEKAPVQPAEKVPAPAESTAVKSQKDSVVKEKVEAKVPVQAAESTAVKPKRDTMAMAKLPAEKIPPPAETPAAKPPVVDTVVKIKQPQPERTLEVHKPESTTSELYFTVQIATSGKLLSEQNPLFKGEKNIVSENVSGLFKYMTGKYTTLNQAIVRQNQLRAAGFPDAFVVAYHNGTRITLKEARMLLEKN